MKRYIILIFVFCVSGCGRYVRWGKAQFDQVGYREIHFDEVDPYVQSVDQYDGFNSVGHFDMLWYARPVMDWYMMQYSDRTGCSKGETYERVRKEQLAEQKRYIVIYLLMPYENTSIIPQLSVSDDDVARWSIQLAVDDVVHKPVGIKKITRVPPEIAQCFGQRYDEHYRVLYRIHFARCPQESDDLLAKAQELCVTLHSARYTISASWTPQCLERHRLLEEPIQ